MKTLTHKTSRIMFRSMFTILALLFSGQILMASQVDLGIFTVGTNLIQVKIRPDVTIPAGQIIGEIRYTIRYPDHPSVSITTLNSIAPFNVGYDVLNTASGFKYRTFVASAFTLASTINAGQEVLISSFVYTGGGSAHFTLVNPGTTFSPYSTNYYFEVICAAPSPICAATGQVDTTGIFYALVATIPISNWAIVIVFALIAGFILLRPGRF